MSREIKFRVYSELTKEMMNHENINVGAAIDTNNWNKNSCHYVMQFTGLKDKNGADIYEGDIVKVGDHYDGEWVQHDVHKIEWCSGEGYPAFELSPTPDHRMNGLAYIFQSGEQDIMVIGNIHKNPELLEK